MAYATAGILLPPPLRSHATAQVPGRRRRRLCHGRTELSAICSSGAPPARTGSAAAAASAGGSASAAGGGSTELCTLGVSVEDTVRTSRRHAECLDKVRSQLRRVGGAGEAMATVDALQRLGIDYHFQEEVGALLKLIHESFVDGAGAGDGGGDDDLHDVSLSFRLLRQGGFHVPTDPFDKFMDGQGNFKESISKDILGLLSLHEASYLGVGTEHVLDEAHAFSQRHLKASMGWLEPGLAQQVGDALDHPFHTTPKRYKIKKYLEQFKKRSSDDVILLGELARLDFNMVQTLHRSELLRFTKWWNDLGMSQDLMFARNQPVKWYMWSLAGIANPKFSDHRFHISKCIALVYIIDDIFDVYGTLEELILFTDRVKKWEQYSSEVGTLPSYMEMCYTTLYDVTNEIACKVHKEHGWNPIHSLKRSWIILFEAFLKEARWFASGHVPMTDEYLRNGVISSGVHVALIHIFFLLGQNLTMDNITCLEQVPSLISMPATILRLWDDLGSAKDENQDGFDGSYIESHMREHEGCSITSARSHVMGMISTSWKSLNMGVMSSNSFSPDFLEASLNSARMIKAMYSYEGNQRLPMLQNLVNLLLFEYA